VHGVAIRVKVGSCEFVKPWMSIQFTSE